MSEEEMKIKEIEELSKEICNGCQTRHKCENNDCCAMSDIVAEWLYKKGYRRIIPNVDFVVRAGDLVKVREKAIKEILQDWYDDVVHGMGVDGYYIKEYAKKYGVEVEE